MASSDVKVNDIVDYNKLTPVNVLCPICRSILIKPVTLPCSHGFCASCFEGFTRNANLICPVCRIRVGSWLRSAAKSNKLINNTLWSAIQTSFPTEINRKLYGQNGTVGLGAHLPAGDYLRKLKGNNSEQNDKPFKNRIKPFQTEKVKYYKKAASTSDIQDHLTRTDNNKPNVATSVGAGASKLDLTLKQYTCRILCQGSSSSKKESATLETVTSHRKHSGYAESVRTERSNSIEAEYLYFKPIDYKQSPPSAGLSPIRVPVKRLHPKGSFTIVAPCGQRNISISSLQSAFARLPSALPEDTAIEAETSEATQREPIVPLPSVSTVKRKQSRNQSRNKNKRSRISQSKTPSKITGGSDDLETAKCDSGNNNGSLLRLDLQSNSDLTTFKRHPADSAAKATDDSPYQTVSSQRSLQEKSDFVYATKLQKEFDESAKYATRSRVPKRSVGKRHARLGLVK